MSNFARQTKTVTLPSGDTVIIRKLSFGRKQAITDASAKVSADMQEVDLRAGSGRKETLYQGIVSWAGPGFEGAPVTRENIDDLEDEIADILLTEIDNLSAPLSDDEKKASAAH